MLYAYSRGAILLDAPSLTLKAPIMEARSSVVQSCQIVINRRHHPHLA